jgi:hypothetical protein
MAKNTEKTEAQKPTLNLKRQRDEDREVVRGVFRFYEVPGGSMNFVFRAYKEDKVERYDLVDGQVYSIPLGVAKHLNKNGWYPVHAYTQTEGGGHAMKIGHKVRRFGFQSLEFVDIADMSEVGVPLISVERVPTPSLVL